MIASREIRTESPSSFAKRAERVLAVPTSAETSPSRLFVLIGRPWYKRLAEIHWTNNDSWIWSLWTREPLVSRITDLFQWPSFLLATSTVPLLAQSESFWLPPLQLRFFLWRKLDLDTQLVRHPLPKHKGAKSLLDMRGKRYGRKGVSDTENPFVLSSRQNKGISVAKIESTWYSIRVTWGWMLERVGQDVEFYKTG